MNGEIKKIYGLKESNQINQCGRVPLNELSTISPWWTFFMYIIFIKSRDHMPITLRPHQERIAERMVQYNKGQVIVPTSGGKTMCMITDVQRTLDATDCGTTIVVVAPRILLAEQLALSFLR